MRTNGRTNEGVPRGPHGPKKNPLPTDTQEDGVLPNVVSVADGRELKVSYNRRGQGWGILARWAQKWILA